MQNMIVNFIACLFGVVFIILIAILLFHWLRYVLRNMPDMQFPYILAHLSIIGAIYYSLWTTLLIIFKSCNGVVPPSPPTPTSPTCTLNVKIFDRVQSTNNLSNPKDDTWSFQLIVEGDKVTKKGWVTTVQGKSIKGQYGLPVRVKDLKNFTSTAFTILDKGNSECNTSSTVEPPNIHSPPPPLDKSNAHCKDLSYCFTLEGFSVGQLLNKNILLYYDAPSDTRRQKKLFFQYFANQKWSNVSEQKVVCNGVEANILRPFTVFDSIRTAVYPKDMPQSNHLTLIVFPIQNGEILCDKITTKAIKDDDVILGQ